ncbi:MAG: Gfo/Idh/MocA family oxidoreductase [bacterium]
MIKIGIIGCGHWGPNYVRNFNALADCKVVECCDLSEEQLNKIKKQFPDITTQTDYLKMLKNPEIDAVVVATSTITHYQIAKDVLEHDKHVLIEKPITYLPKEGQELVKLSNQKGKILMVGHTFLYNAGIRKVKEYIDDGSIGKIYYLHATRTHLGLIREDVNVIWDLAPHDISIFSYFLNMEPINVSAKGGFFLKKDRADVSFLTLEYPNGIIGNIHVSWIDSNKVREIVVVGSKKRIVFDDLNPLEPVRVFEKGVTLEGTYDGFGEFKLALRDGDIISPKVQMIEPLKTQCQHFLNCITHNQTPFTDGKSGVKVVKVLRAIEESLAKNGVAVNV